MTDSMKPAWGKSEYHQLALYLQTSGADSTKSAVTRKDLFKWVVREACLFTDKEDRDRAMRDCMAQGVKSGEYPVICSGHSGYYVTKDPEQIKAAIDFLDSRIESLAVRKAGLTAAYKEAKRRESERARGVPDSGHRTQGSLF